MTSTKHFCSKCGLECFQPEFSCPFCGEKNIIAKEYNAPRSVTQQDIRQDVIRRIELADSFVQSKQRCFCGADHLMVWPTKRDEENYNRARRLTALPQCPDRIRLYAKNIKDIQEL